MANNITIKDASAAEIDVKTTDNAGVHTPHHIVDSSALPTGAATSAKQDTVIGHLDGVETLLGTIDGDTAYLTNSFYADGDSWVDDTSHHLLIGGVYQATPHTVTDSDTTPLLTDANGRLVTVDQNSAAIKTAVETIDNAISGSEMQVDIVTMPNVTVAGSVAVTHAALTELAAAIDTEMQVDVVSSALPSGAATEAKQDTIIGHVDGLEGLLTTIDADTGAIMTAVQLIDNAISGNEMQVDVVAALPAGTNNIGDVDIASIAAGDNNIGNVDVVTLPALPAGNNNIGDVDVASIAAGTNSIGNVGLVGRTTGGMSIFRSIDIDESEEEVKATAGQVFSISAFNRTAAPLYLKLYNATAANVTVGTTTPVLTFVVPANADSDGAGFIWNNEIGFAFGTAISVAATTGVADNDTGAPGANDCIVNIGYV